MTRWQPMPEVYVRVRRLLASVGVLAALVIGQPAADGSARCPNPKTCDSFSLAGYHWGSPRASVVHVPYWVNPTQPWVSGQDFIGAIRAATRTWMAADPRIRFDYQGTTTSVPGVQDGVSVIGAGVVPAVGGLAVTTPYVSDGNRVTEADLAFALTSFFEWDPCQQKDNSCGRPARRLPTGTWFGDVQGIATHELGHVLGLDHPADEAGEELTMSALYDQIDASELRYQTLGLGDILGVRALYPCRCAAPRVFSP
ncbi:MAG: hypothetical protein QOK42_1720 [Frankiaceae bacterium]|nr:hypothetical protein [Frankiaceae bacterium]